MKAWGDLRKLPRELWILCFATLVNRLGTMALPFLVLYITRGMGFSAARAGAALAVYGAVALLVGPISGRLSDRVGAVKMMEWSLIASGLILLLFPLAQSWPAILGMTALFAATNESFRPASFALVGELSPPAMRKSAFALSRLAVNLGMSVGPAIGGFLAQQSFSLLFWVDGFTTLTAAAILLLTSFHSTVSTHSKNLIASRAPHGDDARSFLKSALFTDRVFRVFLLGGLPVSIIFFQHESTLPIFLVRDLHLSESAYGMLFTINTLLIIALEIPLNSAMANWSYRSSLALGSLLFAVGFGALAISDSFLDVAATVVIWTFGEMILFPAMSAYISEIAPPGRNGEYMGFYFMSFSVAFVLGPWLGTLTMDYFGSFTLWICSFAVGLISVAALGRTKCAQS